MKLIRSSALIGLILALNCCALIGPLPAPTTLEQRIAAIPTSASGLSAEIEIRLDEYQVPFVIASSDDDAAFGLGLMHAHLRLGQMEILRRIAQQRVSEMFGPLAADIEHTLRILNPDKAVPEIEAILPSETLSWIKSYVAGINAVLLHSSQLPHEFGIFGMQREEWTVRDVLSISRLAATEVNWLFWFGLLQVYGQPGYEELLERLARYGDDSRGSFSEAAIKVLFSGSNAIAVSGKRSSSGAALIASDPHVGLTLPNLWVLAGISSPGYQVVGMSLPGLPVVLLGRNSDIGWGATNMMALTSSLVKLEQRHLNQASLRQERIKNRFWFDRKIQIRETEFGPVMSDAPLLSDLATGPFALRWLGHEPSDELTTFLKVMRASNWEEFRQAFSSYRVSAQNFLYADRRGNIGHILATGFSAGAGATARVLLGDPLDEAHAWGQVLTPLDLPSIYNPSEGILLSANNRPVQTEPAVTFFANGNSRIERMHELLGDSPELISLRDLKQLQQDVRDPLSHSLARRMLELIGDDTYLLRTFKDCLEDFRLWEGHYASSSRGALLFHLTLSGFAARFYPRAYSEAVSSYILSSQAVYDFVLEDLGRPGTQAELRAAFIEACEQAADKGSWGDFHRLELQHILGNIPLFGRRYRFHNLPAEGSTGTLRKAAHAIGTESMRVRYGQNARHVSDLSSLDENYFVLVGGQDGWLGSQNFLDQLVLWERGDFVKVPLSLEQVRARFKNSVIVQSR